MPQPCCGPSVSSVRSTIRTSDPWSTSGFAGFILFLLATKRNSMKPAKPDVLHGSLVLMVLRTLETLGPQHGWGIARRIEQTSGDLLELNQGTLYPSLL